MASKNITVTRKSKDFGEKLFQLQKQEKLCDSTLSINGKRFPVHAHVLAASSKYFESIFVESGLKEMIFEDVDEEALKSLIEYCYTGTLEIPDGKIEELIIFANLLSIDTFVESCADVLKSKLNVENCISILKISRSENLEDLNKAALKLIEEKFNEVYHTSGFLNSEYSDINELFKSISNVSAIDVFTAIKAWIDYNIEQRKIHIIELLNFVKLECIPNDILISLLSSLCNLNGECFDKISNALQSRKNTLIAIGTANQSILATFFEVFDRFNETWVDVQKNDFVRTMFVTVLLEEKLIMIGGHLYLKTVESYDLKTGQMETLSSLNNGRYLTTAVNFKGNIFVFGGLGEKNTHLSSVERWDPISRKWSEVAPMKIARIGCAAVVWKNRIYLAGGMISTNNFSSSLEIYDPSTDEWKTCASMNFKRYGLGMTVIGDYIYAVGGQNDSNQYSSTFEKYDILNDKWTSMYTTDLWKFYVGASNYDGHLVIAGGQGQGRSCEYYDEINNKWVKLPNMNNTRNSISLLEVPHSLVQRILCENNSK